MSPTIDLSRAYKQMEVADKSRFLLGLFRHCRLPFGIATAPAMWQRAMSVVLQGCKGVVYYIDDILVTGQTRQDHENNLWEVFRCLQQFGQRSSYIRVDFSKNLWITWDIRYPVKDLPPPRRELQELFRHKLQEIK